jgi:hypothetical protein
MSQANWTLNEKMRPERVEDHRAIEAELESARRELAAIGLIARLMPGPGKRRRQLQAVVKNASIKLKACYGPPGFDLNPPRIGIDEKATKWYRKHLAQDPEAWPLPPDEMVEEMTGEPVWHLTDAREVQHLPVGWPLQGFPLPAGPSLPLELERRMKKHLTPEEAVSIGEDLQEATLRHFRNRYDVLQNADFNGVVQAMVKGAVPGGPKGSIDPTDVELGNGALAAAQWLVFWGRHGYGFKCSEPASG